MANDTHHAKYIAALKLLNQMKVGDYTDAQRADQAAIVARHYNAHGVQAGSHHRHLGPDHFLRRYIPA